MLLCADMLRHMSSVMIILEQFLNNTETTGKLNHLTTTYPCTMGNHKFASSRYHYNTLKIERFSPCIFATGFCKPVELQTCILI